MQRHTLTACVAGGWLAAAVSLVAAPAGADHPWCPGDVNHDAVVDVDDVLMLLANWGKCPVAPPDDQVICCVAHGGLGCPPFPLCEECVCGQDPFCCDVAWDGICVGRAIGVCADSCPCRPPEIPCIGDLNDDDVVDVDDLLILLAGWGECPAAPDPDMCCSAHDGIGCIVDPPCERCVCAQDGFCCDVAWDGICAGRATGVCECECACAPPCWATMNDRVKEAGDVSSR